MNGENYNPKRNERDITDAQFKSVSKVKSADTLSVKKQPGFFSRATYKLDALGKRGLKATGRGIAKSSRAVVKIVGPSVKQGLAHPIQTTTVARKKIYEKRALGLERRQNIATYKANIASQKQIALQQKTVSQEAKLKQLEIKAARREFLKNQRAQKLTARRQRFGGLVKKPLSDSNIKKSNPISGNGGFFAGVKKQKKGGFFG